MTAKTRHMEARAGVTGTRMASAARGHDGSWRGAGLLKTGDVSLFAEVRRHGHPLLVMHGGPSADHYTMLPLPAREPGEWRHQTIPAHRPAYFPRPSEERDVVGHASYAAGRQTPEEAAAELDLLDYVFHLFTERSTGQDSVIYRTAGGYRLAMAYPKPGRLGPVPGSMTVSKLPAPRLAVEEAVERLEAMGQPFVFFADIRTGRGSLIYHRYDGHYGLIRPAGERA